MRVPRWMHAAMLDNDTHATIEHTIFSIGNIYILPNLLLTMTKKEVKNLDDDFPEFDHFAEKMHDACGVDKVTFDHKIEQLVKRISELEQEFGTKTSCEVQALEEIMDKRELAYMVAVAKRQMANPLSGLGL